nr:DUF3850 domain-containing protein [uncultured Pseudomonas sp.]
MSGAKTAEVRRNDRGFQVGDTVRLMEVNPDTGNWTGAADQVCTITHIQTGYGLPDDMCVLSYGKVGHDYKAHWMGFMDRTDWMQEKGQVPAKYLGWHRADILTDMLREAREALARVEAERDAERARGDAAVGDANEAEAQLAEAVGVIQNIAQTLEGQEDCRSMRQATGPTGDALHLRSVRPGRHPQEGTPHPTGQSG